jgi:hypothetical protein
LLAAVWNRKIEPAELRDEQRCAGARCTGNFFRRYITVGVLLLDNTDKTLASRNVDSLPRSVIENVVRVSGNLHLGDDFSGIGVKDRKRRRFAKADK